MSAKDFLPYGQHHIDEDDIAAVADALRRYPLSGGPLLDEFENAFAANQQVADAVVCANGTAALHLALMAAGIGEGDYVIVPSVTFLSTANAVRMVGAEVIFADVHPDNGLMTVESYGQALSRASGPVRAVMPVYLSGHFTAMELAKQAREHGQLVIADACHALGGSFADGGKAGGGSHADISTFSLHPVKAIAMGEGGMVTTDNKDYAHKMRLLRSHHMVRDPNVWQQQDMGFDGDAPNPWYYEMTDLGYNYRPAAFQCALGISQLKRLADFHARRAELAQLYLDALAPLAPFIRPVTAGDGISGWHLFQILIDFKAIGKSRRQVMQMLHDMGIGTQVHYIPVSHQPYYARRYGRLNLPGTEAFYSQCLSIPLFYNMKNTDVQRVVEALALVISA